MDGGVGYHQLTRGDSLQVHMVSLRTLAGQMDWKLPHPKREQPLLLLFLLFENGQKLFRQVVGGLLAVLGQAEPQVDLQLCKDLTRWTSWRLD